MQCLLISKKLQLPVASIETVFRHFSNFDSRHQSQINCSALFVFLPMKVILLESFGVRAAFSRSRFCCCSGRSVFAGFLPVNLVLSKAGFDKTYSFDAVKLTWGENEFTQSSTVSGNWNPIFWKIHLSCVIYEQWTISHQFGIVYFGCSSFLYFLNCPLLNLFFCICFRMAISCLCCT